MIHKKNSSRQPGNNHIIIRLSITVPFQRPQVVQSDLPRRTVHKAHVDGPAMPVYGEAAHAAAPGCSGINLPPIAHDRGSTFTLE